MPRTLGHVPGKAGDTSLPFLTQGPLGLPLRLHFTLPSHHCLSFLSLGLRRSHSQTWLSSQVFPRPLPGGAPTAPLPAKPSRASPLVFLAEMTRGQRALPPERAGQVDLSGEQDSNPLAGAQLYSTIKMWQFCLWNHLEPNVSKTSLSHTGYGARRNATASQGQGAPPSPPGPFPMEPRRRRQGHPPICSMRFLQESAGMGWII